MSIKNDRWSALSLKDRADLMNVYITNGISDLKKMKKHYNGIPYRDLNTSDYDYFNASPEMAPTEEGQHWDSRNPYTGQILKSENHPTFDLAVEGEKNAGYKIVRGYDGNLYSIPNQPDNYVEEFNSFGEGSWKDTALLGASFIPFVGTGVDIYNLIKDPSWENAGWAALSLGSDVLGLTALKGLAKSAKLAKGVKAVKALEQAKTAEKYTEAVRKGLQLERTGNPKKIALAAGRIGQSYYDNLVATRQLKDATIRAENLAAKSKILNTTNKTIDFYGNVINEKEDLKELLYANGGRILDGTEVEQTLSGKPLTRRVARSVHSYGLPEHDWDITKTPGIIEWYNDAYNASSDTSPYPETETITEEYIPQESISTMSRVENFNLTEPLQFINSFMKENILPKTIENNTTSEIIKPISHPSISRESFKKYVINPVRSLRWKAQGFEGWSDEDLNYLYDRLSDAGWDPKALMYGIDRETNFRTHVKNKNTSAIGLAQLTKAQMQTLFGENADKVYEEYSSGTRSVRDVIDDTIKQYKWMYDRIKSEPENMGYGRLKVNLLAPNASLNSVVPDIIYKHSLTAEQKKHLKKGVSTYRDLMSVYDKEFEDRFGK